MKFTILGETGFIGSNLISHFEKNQINFDAPKTINEDIFSKKLGNVIYSIGISDFQKRPFETIDAHVCLLKKLLQESNFDSFLYLSSTRIYYNSKSTLEEEPIIVSPSNLNDLYNISKIMGESLCLASNKNVKIARLSNVSGITKSKHLFLPWIIRDAIMKNKITLFTKLESEKDYVHIDDVVPILPKILIDGKYKIYNVAAGFNTKSKEIVEELVKITGCAYEVIPDAPLYSFPPIHIERLKKEFDFKPTPIVQKLEKMVGQEKSEI